MVKESLLDDGHVELAADRAKDRQEQALRRRAVSAERERRGEKRGAWGI